jgi:hypothetical protein
VCLGELTGRPDQPATLDQVPETFLDLLAARGFDWVWLLGIWQTGPAGRNVSRSQAPWRREFLALLPDLTEDDIVGSPFAVQSYTPSVDFGGAEGVARFRERLRQRNMRLLLDFVPNHTALDHPWVWDFPEYYIRGDEEDLRREPHNYCRVETRQGPRILAHGRDPYFPGWLDTVQLNYRALALRRAMTAELARVASLCDGVRCDMAMLVLPEVIHRTWGTQSMPADGTPPIDAPFWPEAIGRVRGQYPGFVFMAEVYWDLEWTLQQQGFDYTYDKRLYDRLYARHAVAVRGHLLADPEFQRKSVRFLDNHDEPRAASAFPLEVHQAAAVLTFLVPGLRFFHEGQLEGRRQRASMHLRRRPQEAPDRTLTDFYRRLLECVRLPLVRDGSWQLLDCRPAWEHNHTWGDFIAFTWEGNGGERLFLVVNYAPIWGQCYVNLPLPELRGRTVLLRDRLRDVTYERDGTDLVERGLYLDMPGWQYHVFDVSTATR